MRRQQAILRQLREEPIEEELPPPPPDEKPAEASEHDDETVEEEIDTLFNQVEAFLLDRELFVRHTVAEGHSDLQQGDRRNTMDRKEFLIMLRSLGVMEDSENAPMDAALLKITRKISKGEATRAFLDAGGVEAAREAAAKNRNKVNARSRKQAQLAISELDYEMYSRAATSIATLLTSSNNLERPKDHAPRDARTVVASNSGIQMERLELERSLKKTKERTIQASPFKSAMPKHFQKYREERRKLLFSNLPASFHCPDAPPAAEGVDQIDIPSEDSLQDKVEHFLCDKLLFFKYCMIEGHSSLQSGSRQKSMDLKEFMYMLNEIGALKAGELGRGAVKFDQKSTIKEAGGEGCIPAIEGLKPKLLNKKQATNCFRAAMAQAKTPALIAAGELNFELYRIAGRLVAKLYVHGEPEEVEVEEAGVKGGGRASCPPVIPLVPPVSSNTEIYTRILEELPRARPNGEDPILDEIEELFFNPDRFEKYCALEGHSDLQSSSRRSTMDQYEWFRFLVDLGLMPADVLKENKIVDPFLQKKEKSKPPPKYPDVVNKLQCRLTKEQAVSVFRRALGLAQKMYGAPSGELNFRRFCTAAQLAAQLLVYGEDRNADTEDSAPRKVRRLLPGQPRARPKKKPEELPEWNGRFTVPNDKDVFKKAQKEQMIQNQSDAKVSFKISSDESQPERLRVEHALSKKCLDLAANGDRTMLREEFCTRFATREAFAVATSFASAMISRTNSSTKDTSTPSNMQASRTSSIEEEIQGNALAQDVNTESNLTRSRKTILYEAVVDTLEQVHLVPGFIGREAIMEILASSEEKGTDTSSKMNSRPKSVSFGKEPRVEESAGRKMPEVSSSVCHHNRQRKTCKHCAEEAANKTDKEEEEDYGAILAALVRSRPYGEDQLLDDCEKVLLDPGLFERYCMIEGHSALQKGQRAKTMDQREWLQCLADLGLVHTGALRRHKVDKNKKDKASRTTEGADLVNKLHGKLSKERAISAFRQAVGKSDRTGGGELNFSRFCQASLYAAKLLVYGKD